MNLSRLAVNGLFAINGFAYANWMARLPDFQEVYGMDNGTLGMVLLCHAVGALIAMPISGVLIVKYGSRNITVWSGFLFVIMTPLLPLMPNVLTLGLWYGLMGSASGMLDVSMNAQAVLVERQMNKPIMSSFHGVFSAGMMVGAGVAAVAIGQQLNLLQHLLIIAIIGLPLVTWSSRNLVADAQQQNTVEEDSHFRWPARSLWGIGLVAFCCMLGEGSMADWSTIYMENFALADEAIAPLGLAAFSTAMMIGRFMGDRARQQIGDRKLMVLSSLVASAGLAVVLSLPMATLSIVGFFFVGLGLATIVPIAYSIAGNAPGLAPGVGISMVTTIGYSGFLFGPPLIGFIADWQTLRVALVLVLVLFLVMSVLSYVNGQSRAVSKQETGHAAEGSVLG